MIGKSLISEAILALKDDLAIHTRLALKHEKKLRNSFAESRWRNFDSEQYEEEIDSVRRMFRFNPKDIFQKIKFLEKTDKDKTKYYFLTFGGSNYYDRLAFQSKKEARSYLDEVTSYYYYKDFQINRVWELINLLESDKTNDLNKEQIVNDYLIECSKGGAFLADPEKYKA